MQKRPSPTRAPLDNPFYALPAGPPDPWPKPPSRESGSNEWSKWLRKFLRQFIREWTKFETSWERCSGGWYTGDAPDHLTVEPPGLFSEAAWAMVKFGDVWFSSSEKKPGPVEKYFRRIRDHIHEGTYAAVLADILRRCLHDIENAVDRAETQISVLEQPKPADDPPTDPDQSTEDAGGNGQTEDPGGAVASRQSDLAELGKMAPPDIRDGNWIDIDATLKEVHLVRKTLTNRRSDGIRTTDGKGGIVGIDSNGRWWWKKSLNAKNAWYYKSSLSGT